MSIGDDIKWVLIISFGSNAIGGGSGTGYFIGNFENGCFYAEAPMKWIDYGRDNYAGVTWNNTDKDRRIFIAWMNNWIYANYTPTKPWRGSMTVARNLELSKINNEYWLVQKPVLPEASEIFTVHEFEPGIISGKQVLARDVPGVYQLEFNINFINKGHLIIGLSETDQEGTYLHINTIDQHAKLDRSKSGIIDFEKSFASTPYCPLLTSSIIDVRIFVDATAIEIFLYEGIRVISSQVFPRQHGGSVSFNSVEGIQQIPTVKYTQYSEASRPKVQEQLHV
jgi:fructan beta-fructosidase